MDKGGKDVFKINLIRIDSRLIHGQVITKWLRASKAEKIIIVDNFLSKDPFMSKIYMAAAPQGVTVEIYSIESVIEALDKDIIDGNVLVLFKDVSNCYESFCKGFPMKQVIGGLPSAPGRTIVLRAISLDKQDVEQLKEMESKGVNIILQIIPENPETEFQNVIKKFKF